MREEHRTLRQSPAGESVSLEIGPLRSHQPVSRHPQPSPGKSKLETPSRPDECTDCAELCRLTKNVRAALCPGVRTQSHCNRAT